MKQATFASLSYAAKMKRTRHEVFLGEMEKVVPLLVCTCTPALCTR